jgi:hypothetical protein
MPDYFSGLILLLMTVFRKNLRQMKMRSYVGIMTIVMVGA